METKYSKATPESQAMTLAVLEAWEGREGGGSWVKVTLCVVCCVLKGGLVRRERDMPISEWLLIYQ